MIEQIHKSIGRSSLAVDDQARRSWSLEEALDASAQRLYPIDRQRRCAVIALCDQVVRENDAVALLDLAHLVAAVGVERNEGEVAGGAAYEHPPALMLEHHRAASEAGGRAHDERTDHVVGLLGILMRSEELPRAIDEQIMQVSPQAALFGEAEIATNPLELGHERSSPAPLVDRHVASRNLPRIPDTAVESRLALVAMASRPCDAAESEGRHRADRETDAADVSNFETQIIRRTDSARRV